MGREEEIINRLCKLEERVRGLEGKSCIYEARPTYWGHDSLNRPATMRDQQVGAWCRTHGWDCPNMGQEWGKRLKKMEKTNKNN